MPDPLSADALAAIAARAAAATPGPWGVWTSMDNLLDILPEGPDGPGAPLLALYAPLGPYSVHPGPQEQADAAFIAAARTDIPALLAEIARLRALVPQATCQRCRVRYSVADGPHQCAPRWHGNRRWTPDRLWALRQAREAGASRAELAARYGVSPARITAILHEGAQWERRRPSVQPRPDHDPQQEAEHAEHGDPQHQPDH